MYSNDGFWGRRNCLVTGGMGFGGSHLSEELLKKGASVYILDRLQLSTSYLTLMGLLNQVNFIQGDVRDLELLKYILNRFEITHVFHLAAQPIVPMANAMPYETLSINVMGTYAVLEAVRTSVYKAALVFASSAAVYGTTRQIERINEEQIANVTANIYAPSKIAADVAVTAYVRTYGLRAAVCRFINTYGPGNTNFSTIVPTAITNLIEDKPFYFGTRDDGSSSFDYLYINDMAHGYMAVAENIDHVQGEAFNFSGGRIISVSDLVRLISKLYDGQERVGIFKGPQQAVPICKSLDCSKAHRLLGWQADTTLESGLKETIEWYKRFWPQLMKGKHEYAVKFASITQT